MDLFFCVLFLLLLVAFIFYLVNNWILDRKLLNAVTSKYRGTRAERKLVVDLQKLGIPAENIFHDLYLEHSKGKFTQIDVVVIMHNGIIVFEDKDYSGWLFGSGNQEYWTQVLNYGSEKNRFYNPVKQNKSHVQHLRDAIGNDSTIFSCVIFHGNCVLKNVRNIPDDTNVIYAKSLRNYIEYVKSVGSFIENLSHVRDVLKTAVQNGNNPSIVESHISHVRQYCNN